MGVAPSILSVLAAAITVLVDVFIKPPSIAAPVPERILKEISVVSQQFQTKVDKLKREFEAEELIRKLEIEQLKKKLEETLKKHKTLDLARQQSEEASRLREKTRRTIYEKALKIGVDAQNYCNLGFVGSRGVGKSSLINALRGKKPGDPDYAKTSVNEQKIDGGMAPYRSLDHKVVLWDIEGGETHDVPAATYYDDKCLYLFDRIILLFDKKFGEFELKLVASALRDNVDVCIVRTKSDQDISALLHDNVDLEGDVNRAVEHYRRTTRQFVNDELKKAGIAAKQPVDIYIISSRVLADGAAPQDGKPEIDEGRFVHDVLTALIRRRYTEETACDATQTACDATEKLKDGKR